MYAKGKKKNSSYTYGQAMKDAKSTYKRKGKAVAAAEEAAPKKRRARKKKSKLKTEEAEE